MWLLDRWGQGADVVRAGSEQVELYRRTAAGLVLQARQRLAHDTAPGHLRLAAGLATLLGMPVDSGARSKSVHVVLESVWAPVMLVPAGDRPWLTRPMEALLRHRLSVLYGGDLDSDWELRLVHRAGDLHGLGFGLSGAVKQVVVGACTAAGRSLASLQPALAWGWQAKGRPHLAQARGWWAWAEQDRSLIARVVQGCAVALNPAADKAPPESEQLGYWEACVDRELLRQGQSETSAEPILVGSWNALHAPTVSSRITRWSVAGPEPASLGGMPASLTAH